MEALLPQALRLFAGSASNPVENKRDVFGLVSQGLPTLFSLSPSRRLPQLLRQQGYTRVLSFVPIPSRTLPRWMLPVGDPSSMLSGTCMYQPHKWAARAIKKALIGMMKMGWSGECCSKILIATTGKLALERLVTAVTGETEPVFAMSLGRQAAVRKLTVQVMRPSGAILGYIKLPLSVAATERVRNEARFVEQLWTFPKLRAHIPQVLYSGDWNGTYVIFQSPLDGERGPAILNGLHEDFFRALHNVHSSEIPGQTVINTVAAGWETAVCQLGREWDQMGNEVLHRATQRLQRKTMRCGVMHGDFTPWNTRVRDGKLLSFDWESADWELPVSWDSFHFHVLVAYCFGKNKDLQFLWRDSSERISFMLFLLSSVCRFLKEENHEAIGRHMEVIGKCLRMEDDGGRTSAA